MMKKSSTYAAAKGINPARQMEKIGFMKVAGSGIARAMEDVTVGYMIDSALYPKYAPKKTSGIETQHHMAATMIRSKNGTLAVERKKARIVLKKTNIPKHSPGKPVLVNMVHSCH